VATVREPLLKSVLGKFWQYKCLSGECGPAYTVSVEAVRFTFLLCTRAKGEGRPCRGGLL
jgi:hypothetical protein